MGVATEILSLRQNKSSSVETLLSMLDWQKSAQDYEHILSRGLAVAEAADMVLLNVAVHAAEAPSSLSTAPNSMRARQGFSRKRRSSSKRRGPQKVKHGSLQRFAS